MEGGECHECITDRRLIAAEAARAQQLNPLFDTSSLQRAIFNSANFSSIATDAKGVIQSFNVGAEKMLGYTAAEVTNNISPADINDPQEIVARAMTLSVELGTQIEPGFDALSFKAARGIEDIYELTYVRKDGSRFLKRDSATSAIPVIALTALAMKGDEERIRAAGCDGYIAKPMRYQAFLATIAQLARP
jgi:CheY-like chemotaxis protein